MDRVILVDKPKGWTSFDVVAKIRGALSAQGINKPKVGHAGTLDPLATGLLIVLTGAECKNQDKYMKQDKTYEVEMKLGETSTTQDLEGEITSVSNQEPTPDEVNAVIGSFIGDVQQVPPVFSAIKIDGNRAYKLARQGQSPEMKPRQVSIHSIFDIKYNYPSVQFAAEVSSGTYIRSLVRDIGDKLNTGAYMTGLNRTKIGKYKLDVAQDIDSVVAMLDKQVGSE